MLDGKSGVYGSMGALLPSLSASISRTEIQTENQASSQYIGGVVIPNPTSDSRSKNTTPSISTNWGILNASSWSSYSAARSGYKASQQSLQAARNDVALSTRQRFYAVVRRSSWPRCPRERSNSRGQRRTPRQGDVRGGLGFEERLLKAQVQTAQSELDQITAVNNIVVQRVALSSLMGLSESQLGEVDTLLTAEAQTFDENALVAEAAKNRPDLRAAELSLASARAQHAAARLARLPYVSASGTLSRGIKSTTDIIPGGSQNSQADQNLRGTLSLNLDIFDVGLIDSRIASSRAALERAQESRDALRRNLTSEVHQQPSHTTRLFSKTVRQAGA